MSISNLSGIVPPIVTPFLPTGEIDVDSLAGITNHLIDGGADGIFVLGSTGEVAYLDDSRRRVVIDTVVKATSGRVSVLAGAIELTSERVIAQSRIAADCGADAIVVTAPIYALNDLDEVERHFRVVAAATALPVFAYDIPVRVKTKLDTAMLVRLGADGVISGVKDSSGDDVGFRRLVTANRVAGSPLRVFTGHEVVVDGMFLLGADGAVPGLANVDIEGYVRLWRSAQAGDWVGALAEQKRLAALFEITAQASGRSGDANGVGSFKVALQALGLIEHATMAHPIETLDQVAADKVRALVSEVMTTPSVVASSQ